jgi:hypothetical protein
MSGEPAYRKPIATPKALAPMPEVCPMCHSNVQTLGETFNQVIQKRIAKYQCTNPKCSMLHYTRVVGSGGK